MNILIFHWIIITSILIVQAYLFYRNMRVRDFLLNLSAECYRWNYSEIRRNVELYESAYDWYFEKLPSYGRLLFSFKPLKVKYWMPKELNDRLFGNKNE